MPYDRDAQLAGWEWQSWQDELLGREYKRWRQPGGKGRSISSFVVVVVAVDAAAAIIPSLLLLCFFDADDDNVDDDDEKDEWARVGSLALPRSGQDIDIPSSSMAAKCNKSLRTSMLLVEWWSGFLDEWEEDEEVDDAIAIAIEEEEEDEEEGCVRTSAQCGIVVYGCEWVCWCWCGLMKKLLGLHADFGECSTVLSLP